MPIRFHSPRQYVISTLNPFAEYCRSKAELLSDAFASVHTRSTLRGTAIDGKVHDLGVHLRSQQLALDNISILDELSSISFTLHIAFLMFQGRRDLSCRITVENTTDKSGSAWTFFTNLSNEQLKYDGRDLEELKKHSNAMLRTVMQELQRRST